MEAMAVLFWTCPFVRWFQGKLQERPFVLGVPYFKTRICAEGRCLSERGQRGLFRGLLLVEVLVWGPKAIWRLPMENTTKPWGQMSSAYVVMENSTKQLGQIISSEAYVA